MEVYLRRNIQGKKIKDGVWLEWRKRERLETVRERERDNKCKVISGVIEKYFYFLYTF